MRGGRQTLARGARFVEYYNHERLHEAIPRASSWSWPYAAPQIPRGWS